MTPRILAACSPGEVRVAVAAGSLLLDYAIWRPGAPDGVGDLHRGRILSRIPAMAGAFVAIAGAEGFLPDSETTEPPTEGTILPVRVTRAAQGGKGPRLSARLTEPEKTLFSTSGPCPALLQRGPGGVEILAARFPDDLEAGLGLARVQLQSDAGAALETVARLRASPNPWRADPRIDLAEAEASLSLGDTARTIDAAARAKRKGELQGAPLLAARALYFQGVGLRSLGRLPEAQAAGQSASELFRESGDLASAAAALNVVGSVLVQKGDLAGARRTFEDTVAIGRAIGSEETRAGGLTNIGVTFSEGGDLAGARASYEEALAIYRRTGAKRRVGQVASNLARVAQRLGRRSEARALFEEAAATLRELGDRSSEAAVLANLAALFVEEGKLQEAADMASRALVLHRATGEASGVAEDRGLQGQVLALRGDLPAAQRELEAAASGADAVGEKLWAARQRI